MVLQNNSSKGGRSNRGSRQAGFTVVELLIATAIFSMILLLLTTGILQISRIYNKGVISSKTQEAARAIVDDVSQSIQFGFGQMVETPTAPSAINVACFGNRRYSYVLGQQLNPGSPTKQKMVADTAKGGCDAGAGGTKARTPGQMEASTLIMPTSDLRYEGGEELLGFKMRLADFKVVKQATGNLYDVTVKVVYGDDDSLNDPALPSASCKNDRSSSQFCAVSEVITTVQRRLQ